MARCFLSALNVAEITKSKLMKSTVKLVTNIKLEMVEPSEEFSETISTLSKLTNTSSKILHKFINTNLDKVLKIDPRANIMMSPHSHDDWALASDGEKIAFEHPATFPEQLANDHSISWSNENDLIYDPFMGSGTTAKMAMINNRNYIGSEISKEYCKIAEQRLKMCGGLFFNSFETKLSNEAGT